MKVKVCGIRSIEDAKYTIECGADAIGLLVGQRHTANDFITPDQAKEIVSQMPAFSSSVLVTHLTDAQEISDLAKYTGVSTIQLHGGTGIEEAKYVKEQLPYIKLVQCLHVTGPESIEEGKAILPYIDAVLLDTCNVATGQVGGTGLTHDWNISKRIVQEYDKPIILAGGLNPDNVAEAIRAVRPYGVDANSGTKNAEGLKDYNKIKAFVANAKRMHYK